MNVCFINYKYNIIGNKRIVGIPLAVGSIVVILVAFIAGLFTACLIKMSNKTPSPDLSYYSNLIQDDKDNVVARERLFRDMRSENIEGHLK
jgi:hypothetical protein